MGELAGYKVAVGGKTARMLADGVGNSVGSSVGNVGVPPTGRLVGISVASAGSSVGSSAGAPLALGARVAGATEGM